MNNNEIQSLLSKIQISDLYLSQNGNDKQILYKSIIEQDISEYIDKNKVLNKINFDQLLSDLSKEFRGVYIFAQIEAVINIAEPTIKSKVKYDDLDLVEEDHKILKGDEEEEKKYVPKFVWKLYLNDGANHFTAFEHKKFTNFVNEIFKKETDFKKDKLKVLIGPNFNVRRGIVYLNSNNLKIIKL